MFVKNSIFEDFVRKSGHEVHYRILRKIDLAVISIIWTIQLSEAKRTEELLFKHGGLQVLIGNLVMSIFVIMPLTQVGIMLGAYTRKGYITMWNMIPMLKGVGWSLAIFTLASELYSVAIGATSLLFFFDMSTFTVPWEDCKFPEATSECWKLQDQPYNKNCCILADLKCTEDRFRNFLKYPALEYLLENKLHHWPLFSPLEGFGEFRPPLIYTTIFTWFVVYIFLVMDVKSYITQLTSFMMGVLGASLISIVFLLVLEGYKYPRLTLLYRDYSNILEFKFWIEIASGFIVHVFPSYTVPLGVMAPPNMSSDSLAIQLTFFKFLFLSSNIVGISISVKVLALKYQASEDCFSFFGMNLLLAVMPEYLLSLNFGFLCAYSWFFFLWCCSLVSAILTCTVFMDSLIDSISSIRFFRSYVSAILCLALCGFNCLMMSNYIVYALAGWRRYICSFVPLIVAFLLCTVLLLYSMKRLSNDYSFIYGQPFPKFVFHSVYGTFIFTFFAVIQNILKRVGDFSQLYDSTMIIYAYIILLICMTIPIVVLAFINYFKYKNLDKAYLILKPPDTWGPDNPWMKIRRINYNPDGQVHFIKTQESCKHECLLQSRRLKEHIEKCNQMCTHYEKLYDEKYSIKNTN